MKSVTILGASGGLARALAETFLAADWRVTAVCRAERVGLLEQQFTAALRDGSIQLHPLESGYGTYRFAHNCDAVVFTQALFEPRPFTAMAPHEIDDEIRVGLTEPAGLARDFLSRFPSTPSMRRNVCFVGSTSAYAGFRNTATYCAVKHGLLGLVRALNDEYAATEDRFWLFSMGTMRTEMGAKVPGQDASTYLDPADVAQRIVAALLSPTNLFEPEVIIRRRTVKFL